MNYENQKTMRDVMKMQKRIFGHMQMHQKLARKAATIAVCKGLANALLEQQNRKLKEALELERSRTRVEDARACFNESMLDGQAKTIKDPKELNANITHSLEISKKKTRRAATELIGDLKRGLEKWKNAAVISVCINIILAIMLFAITNG